MMVYVDLSRRQLPSGKLTQLWKITIFNGKIHYFYGPFSIAMLNYQRVDDFPIEPSHVVGDLPAIELMTQG